MPNRVYSSGKDFAPREANSFLQELTPIKKGDKMILSEFFSIKVFHLNSTSYQDNHRN